MLVWRSQRGGWTWVGLTDVVGVKSAEAFVYRVEDVLPAETHLVDQRTVVNAWRPRVVVHDRVEDLGHDDDLAARDVELLEGLANDGFRFSIRVHVCGVLYHTRQSMLRDDNTEARLLTHVLMPQS